MGALESQADFDVSVVTPSLNQAPFLEQTLRSVVEQTGVSVQYIVVDGNSSDGSREILERYRDRIDVLVIEPDEGQADALAKGFAHAVGDICCYLNSDDYFLPDTLARVVAYFRAHPNVDVVYGHRIFVNDNDEFLKYWILPPHSNYLMQRWDYIPQECAFWRRDKMQQVGGIDPTWRFAMDYDFFVRLMREGCRFARWNAFLGVFRQHDASKTSSQMTTIGMEDVRAVWQRYDITFSRLDSLIAMLFHGVIVSSSWAVKLLLPLPKRFKNRNISEQNS